MKFINVCGYGNTGCTSQVDVLCDYQGVFGVLSPLNQTNKQGKTAYHEIGVLKCFHSLGGALVSKLNNEKVISTRSEIENSLKGQLPSEDTKLSFGANLHLQMRELTSKMYGDQYSDLVADTVSHLPQRFESESLDILIPKLQLAVATWLNGLVNIIETNSELATRGGEKVEVLGLKNDPPGAYPLLSSLIPNGITSAILRDPRDTTFDFNRHYQLGHTDQTVINHCRHYNAQLNSARKQLELYQDIIGESYFVHDFENLVMSESHRNTYVEKMVGKREKVRNYFDAEKSKENIGHHKYLSKEHIAYVTKECMDNYKSYRDYVGSLGMLLDVN